MKKLIISVLIVLFAFTSMMAFAEEAPKFNVSVNFGYQIEASDLDADSNIVIGGNVGVFAMPELEVTAGISLLSTDDETGLLDITETHFLFGAYYNIGNSKFVPRIGAGIDFGILDAEVLWIDESDSGIGFWGAAGVNMKVDKNLVAGLEVRFLSVFLEGGNFGGFQLLAVIGVGL